MLTGPGAGPAEIGAALAGWDPPARRLRAPRLRCRTGHRVLPRLRHRPHLDRPQRGPRPRPPRGLSGRPRAFSLVTEPHPRAGESDGCHIPSPKKLMTVTFITNETLRTRAIRRGCHVHALLGAANSHSCEAAAQAAAPDEGWALGEEEFDSRDAVITKAEVRALALARLAPAAGALHAGRGRGQRLRRRRMRPLRRRRDRHRAGQAALRAIQANAERHAVDVRVLPGEAPQALAGLPTPDAVFVGGGGLAVIEAVAAYRPARIVVALAAMERAGPRTRPSPRPAMPPTGPCCRRPGSPRSPVTCTVSPPPTRYSWSGRRPRPRETGMIGLIAITRAGRASAAQLAAAWPGQTRTYEPPAKQALHRASAE